MSDPVPNRTDTVSAGGFKADVPLVVDLDGTLTKTDVSVECAINLARNRLYDLLRLPFWLLQGRAFLKRRLAEISPVEVASLPYNEELVDYVRQERARGRKIVLATASDRIIADRVASHLGLFDEVIAPTACATSRGPRKRRYS